MYVCTLYNVCGVKIQKDQDISCTKAIGFETIEMMLFRTGVHRWFQFSKAARVGSDILKHMIIVFLMIRYSNGEVLLKRTSRSSSNSTSSGGRLAMLAALCCLPK